MPKPLATGRAPKAPLDPLDVDAPAAPTLAERAARSLAEGRPSSEPFEIQLLEATLDYRATICTVAAAFVPRFADWGFIHLVDGEGVPRRVKVVHADAAATALATEFRSIAPGPGWATLTAQAIRDGAPRLVREVTDEVLHWAAHDDRHLAALRKLSPHSIMVVPFVARSRVLGGITLMRAAQGPGFAEEDLVVARRMATAAALAIDNALTVHAGRLAGERGAAEPGRDGARARAPHPPVSAGRRPAAPGSRSRRP